MENRNKKTTKRSIMLMLVAMLLVISLIGGTVAWLTVRDSLTNTFTVHVGDVKEPEIPDEEDSENGVTQPEDPTDPDNVSLSGNIYEPSFVKDSKPEITLGTVIEKDPYIGIGDGSESSYIFAWWDDNTKYYADADAKEAGTTSEGAFDITVAPTSDLTGVSGKWVLVHGTAANGKSALYVWSDTNGNPVALTADGGTAWTGVLFEDGQITVKSDIYALADNSGNNTVDVYCFIHQATGAEDTDDLYDTALEAAKEAWENNNAVAD